MCRAAILEHGRPEELTRRGPAQRAEGQRLELQFGDQCDKGPLESLFWSLHLDPERRMGTRSGIRQSSRQERTGLGSCF